MGPKELIIYYRYLRVVSHVLGTRPDDPDGLHAGVWELGIAGKLRETLDSVLERVDGGREVLFEDLVYKQNIEIQ